MSEKKEVLIIQQDGKAKAEIPLGFVSVREFISWLTYLDDKTQIYVQGVSRDMIENMDIHGAMNFIPDSNIEYDIRIFTKMP